MLIGIAIYDLSKLDKTHQFHRLAVGQKPHGLSLFSANDLDSLELNSLSNVGDKHFYAACIENEFHYFFKIYDTNLVMAIAARRKLEPDILGNLFMNMKEFSTLMTASYLKGDKITNTEVNQKFQDMVINPIGYIYKEIKIAKIQQELEDTMHILLEAMDGLLERGEKLLDLEKKTVDLSLTCTQFNRRSQELNTCCGGYIVRPSWYSG